MEQQDVEFWERVEASAALYAAEMVVEGSKKEQKTEDRREADRKKRRRRIRVMDATAIVTWGYAFLKLFVFDLDRRALGTFGKRFEGLADYRLFVYAAALLVLVLVLRWRLMVLVAYVAVFPLTVVFWKVPYFIYRRQNWLYAVAAINVVIELFRHSARKVVALCLAVLSFGALCLASSRWLLAPAMAVALGLLMVLYARILYLSLRPSEFLRVQESTVEHVANWKVVKEGSTTGLKLRSQQVETYNKVQLDQFVTELSTSLCINRAMYFWAYQLDRYRQSSAAVLTLLVQYTLLLGVTVFTFTLVNFGLWKGWPDQFTFTGDGSPSFLNLAVYSMSSLVLSAGGGLEAAGDAASALRLLCGICGPVFFIGVLLSLLAGYRLNQESSRAGEVVGMLRERASEQQDRLIENFGVTIEEAIVRLARIGYALESVLTTIASSVPPEFFNKDSKSQPDS